VPGFDFVPLQVPQTSVLENVNVFVAPLMASRKSISKFMIISYPFAYYYAFLDDPRVAPPGP
jgi:hypothetical protein